MNFSVILRVCSSFMYIAAQRRMVRSHASNAKNGTKNILNYNDWKSPHNSILTNTNRKKKVHLAVKKIGKLFKALKIIVVLENFENKIEQGMHTTAANNYEVWTLQRKRMLRKRHTIRIEISGFSSHSQSKLWQLYIHKKETINSIKRLF